MVEYSLLFTRECKLDETRKIWNFIVKDVHMSDARTA